MNSVLPPSPISSTPGVFPSTRYQGSKAKMVDWIWDTLAPYNVHSVLDAFGGTGVVAYKCKQVGKQVTYNDLLPFNHQFGLALIQNDQVTLDEQDTHFLLSRHKDIHYPILIQNHFRNIYFTEEENIWLDQVITNIRQISCPYKHALAFFALAQSCLVKRPYNLFHRSNLYLRMAEVHRSFGNKSSWDKPFAAWFESFVQEANRAIFRGEQECVAVSYDAAAVPGHFDLVYADPPYITSKGVATDYSDFYHFLIGLCQYDQWEDMIDYNSKHRRIQRTPNPWANKHTIIRAFDEFLGAYPNALLAISYRSDGIPSPEEIQHILLRHGYQVVVHLYGNYQYALSKNKKSQEILFVGIPTF